MPFTLDLQDTEAPAPDATPAPDAGGAAEAPVFTLDNPGGDVQEPEGDPVVTPIVREAEPADAAEGAEAAADGAAGDEVDPNAVLDSIFGKPEAAPQQHPAVAALNEKIARLEALLTQQQAPAQTGARGPQAPAPDAQPMSAQHVEHAVANHMARTYGERPDDNEPRAQQMWDNAAALARTHYQNEALTHNQRIEAGSQFKSLTEPFARQLIINRAESKALALAPPDASDEHVAELAARFFDEEQAASQKGRGLQASDYRRIAEQHSREIDQRDRAVFDRRMKSDPLFARKMAEYQRERQQSPQRPRLAGAAGPAAAPAAAAKPRGSGATKPAPLSRAPLGSATSMREAERVLANALRTGRGPRA